MEAGSSSSRAQLGTRIGQYEIIRLLGRGGMGEVHLARDLRLGRLVAVKLLTTQQPDLDARFLAEARATARCRHDNIVVIYEVGEHGGQPYMVLEYLEGQTLREWLGDHADAAGPGAAVPPARAVELMLPIVRALACAHDQGIVHRDLKPENVMLTRTGAVKVLDFGVAKRLALPVHDRDAPGDVARPAGASARVGTLAYMSPEQTTHGTVDHRTDLWSAGIMLFELVAGKRPGPDAAAPGARISADRRTAMPSASERMPELGALAGVIDRCLIADPADRTASAHLLLAELEALVPDRRAAVVAVGAPFAGLAAFQEVDAGRFFGRDRDVDHVVAELRGRPLVAIVGPSGAGKSSLVRAGVIPALKRSGEGWSARTVRPGREPLAALAGVVHDSGASGDAEPSGGTPAIDAIIERLRAEVGYLGAQLRARALGQQRRVVLFVDQLEELYTLGASPDQCAGFLACLAAVADDVSSPLRVLVAMRWDFLDRLIDGHHLAAEVTRGLVMLRAMNRDGMREALLRPVEASDHRFDPPALIDRMIDDLAATPGALPLLQFTAARLWEGRDRERRLLTEASYEQLGGVAGALARHADAVLAGMSQTQQAVARTAFERLVTPERTRALVRVDELRALHRDPGVVDAIVQHLTEMRLVVIERGVDGADRTAELVHDSLIDRWPTLVRWLDDNQDDAAMLARLRAAARDWERSGHAAGLLWTGDLAREARAWRRQYRGELAAVEQRYVAAVTAAVDRARRARRRQFGAILSLVAIAAIAMGWLAWKQAREARRARDATRMAAMQALSDDPTTQLALLREIEDTDAPPPGAVQEARRLLHADVARAVVTEPDAVMAAAFSPDSRRIASASGNDVRLWAADGLGEPLVLRGHGGTVRSAAFSPDGQRVVSASDDRTVRIWNADGRGDPTVLNPRGALVRQAAFSPDGQRLVVVTSAGVRIWNRAGSGEPIALRGEDALAGSAAFSPDGRSIVAAMPDGTVRLWSGDGGSALATLYGHTAAVCSAAFSSDGKRIASASHDKTIRIWNTDGDGDPVVLRGHDEVVLSAAFSPDAQHVASGSRDKTVRVWRCDGRGIPRVLRGHDDTVYSVAYSPDGQRIASASLDGTVRTWDATSTSDPLVLHGHEAPVNAVAFGPDGRRVASASNDKTVQIWSADGTGEPVVLRGHDDAVYSVAFSPDGRRIASGSLDGTVRVWSTDGGAALLVLRGHDASVYSVAFSPDGRRIASASVDMTIRIWNADGSGEPLVLRGHDGGVYSATFSPDGRRIASGSNDKTVRVWSADGRGAPVVLRGHREVIYSAMFSPDGRRIASASDDKTVRVWDADGRGEPLVLRGHADWVYWAEFSPDGRSIVSASKDKTLRIWRADGTGQPVILVAEGSLAYQARFSPDGRRIASASDDRTVRVWQDLAPVTLDDPRLWTATSYCMPIERRIKLLGVSEVQAVRDRRRCVARVAQARAQP